MPFLRRWDTKRPPRDAITGKCPFCLSAMATSMVPRSTPPISRAGRTCSTLNSLFFFFTVADPRFEVLVYQYLLEKERSSPKNSLRDLWGTIGELMKWILSNLSQKFQPLFSSGKGLLLPYPAHVFDRWKAYKGCKTLYTFHHPKPLL